MYVDLSEWIIQYQSTIRVRKKQQPFLEITSQILMAKRFSFYEYYYSPITHFARSPGQPKWLIRVSAGKSQLYATLQALIVCLYKQFFHVIITFGPKLEMWSSCYVFVPPANGRIQCQMLLLKNSIVFFNY